MSEKCSNCGGMHFGHLKCPYTKLPCVVCGTETIYACSDCAIDTGKSVHVCDNPECQRTHETIHPQPEYAPTPTEVSAMKEIDMTATPSPGGGRG